METMNTNTSSAVTNASARAPRRWPRLLFGGLTVLVVGGALSISVAQARGGPDGGGFMSFRMHKILDKVGATDAQKAQIKTIWEGLRPQLKTLHAAYKDVIVHLNADRAVAYGVVAKAMTAVDRAGITKLSVLTVSE